MEEHITTLLRATAGVVADSVHVEATSTGAYMADYTTAQYFGAKHLTDFYVVSVESVLPRGEQIWVLLKITTH